MGKQTCSHCHSTITGMFLRVGPEEKIVCTGCGQGAYTQSIYTEPPTFKITEVKK